jgi:hypothetical protein
MDPKPQKEPKELTVKQQVAEKLKKATNILVAVSNDPSVDQLSASIALTLILNKLDKHAAAVFGGQAPMVMSFLHPEQTFESTTDSLRDFIVSLDKAKADKLRYKVEDDVVKIFITPYKTSISSDDLMFTQGDFNVDAVVALGVTDADHLDKAVLAQGNVLHDATVITFTCADGKPSTLGSLNVHESTASSLCEMLVSLSEALKPGMIDAQIATALLTGIVERTDRFRNSLTSPKTMTVSAQLMSAGANQQLIADQLSATYEPAAPALQQDGDLVSQNVEIDSGEEVARQDGVDALPDEPTPVPSAEEGLSFSLRDAPAEEPVLATSDEENIGDDSNEETVDEKAIEEISIDVHGQLKPQTNLEEAEAERPRNRIIQPLNVEPATPKTDLSHYSIQEDNTQTTPQLQIENHDLTPVVPADSLPQEIQLPEPEPEFPEVADEQTLTDLEKAVHSPHVQDQDVARDAVMQAVNDPSHHPIRPEPKADLNAAPLEEVIQSNDESHADKNEPPVAPPPLPQFMTVS